jgi:DNA repair exonuclease SbcCD ATPase subunit
VSARLTHLEIEGFRGFAERQSIDLDADAIVVRGDNGAGKTSVVDALLWVFVGELAHLAERVRGLRRTEDVVKNRFNPYGARVALTLGVDGVEYIVTRSGDQKNTHLQLQAGDGDLLDGAVAEARLSALFGIASPAELRLAVGTWGLLRQDAIRAALDAAGGALHERLSGLIGLERVSAFATAATRASDALIRERTAARTTYGRTQQRHTDALKRLEAARQAAGSPDDIARLVRNGLATIEDQLPEDVALVVPSAPDVEAVKALGIALATTLHALEQLQTRQRTLRAHSDDPEQLAARAEDAVAAAQAAAEESTARAPALVQLASAAMGLLGSRCPVCEQPIDPDSVREHLQEVLEHSKTLTAQAQASQDRLVRAQAELAQARRALEERRTALDEVARAHGHATEAIAEGASHVRIDVIDLDPLAVDRLVDGLGAPVGSLRDLYRTVNEASGAHVARAADEVEDAAVEVEAAKNQVSNLEDRCAKAKQLEHAAHEAARRILEHALAELQPIFAEVFERLAPNPAFTELLARQDVLRNRNQIVPMVRDPQRGIEANPLLVFSEGQLNVVALSYFLGMALNARDAALPFLVLDDPLQALDVMAILGFSDLCRHIRDHRQLIVTTHDRRFADVLVRKLSPRDTNQTLVVHDFHGWEPNGPLIETSRPAPQPVMRVLHGRAS